MTSERRRRPASTPQRAAVHQVTAPAAGVSSVELALVLVTVACVCLSVTHKIFETDFWQHLLVGKAIWTTHGIPTRQLWSWPTYGEVDTTSSYSWLFRFIIFPVWAIGDLPGLFLWRWLTALATFALLWKTARILGARGPSLYPVLIVCALMYRQRSQVRPEALAAVLLAAMLLVLERRRTGANDRSWWLVLVMWLWANTHVSYYLGLIVLAVHALGDRPPGGTGARPSRRPLWPVILVGAAVTLVNPYGWRALWQPLHYYLVLRHEDVYRSIGEIRPIDWGWNLWNGFPLALAIWILLQVWRARRRRADLVELGLFLVFTAQALAAGRFVGYWALIAAPYLGRDVHQWLASRTWRRWRARSTAAVAAASCVALLLGELARPDMPFGVGLVASSFPQHACDFMAAQGIRGRAFNSFEFGGYMLWRFWPDRSRLPFMDVHQAGTRTERHMYMYAHARRDGWTALNERYHPDFVLARRLRVPGDSLKDFIDADKAWALVFADDAAALYVRRASVRPALVDSFQYAIIPGGVESLAVIRRGLDDPAFRARLRVELDRMIAASPLNSIPSSFRATVHLVEGRLDSAEADLERAHDVDPLVPDYHHRLGTIAVLRGDLKKALASYRRQQRVAPLPELDIRIARIYQALGDRRRAIRQYRRLVRTGVNAAEAADSIRALEGSP